MNFNEMTKRMAREFGLSQREAKRILRFILDEIAHEVNEYRRVYFRGFGSFVKELKPARRYRDPLTGEMKVSPEDLRVRFRAFFKY